jgi:ubiquinone/menaquinone biosynthesis C-methylase UbiE
MTFRLPSRQPRDAGGYVLDASWTRERERLSGLTAIFDSGTLRLCEQLGLGPGWRCLDVGAGTGSVTELLAERVLPGGSVLAVDLDTRFLDPLARAGLEVLRADVTADPLPEAQFDLVHARLLLEHLPERDSILQTLLATLDPGGWLVIEDFDWVTASVVDPPNAAHDRVIDACRSLLVRHGYDPHFGRTLPRRLASIGLEEITTRAESVQVRADAERGVPQWELLVDQLAPRLLALELVTEEDLETFHELWHDGETVCFAPLMVSAAGRRPAQSPFARDGLR